MIDFNPYDVKYIDFCKREQFLSFRDKILPGGRAAAIAAAPADHYIYDEAFKIENVDPQKLYDSGDLTESIYIQEVRISLKQNAELISRVFRKENDYILSNAYKIQYHYVNYWTAERRNLEENTGLCNKVVVFMDKNYNILFAGLIDLEDNTASNENESMELKLYSFAYLLSKVENIEVALFDKAHPSEYNTVGQFGLVGFQWPTGGWEPPPITGESLRQPNKCLSLLVLEALRYYFGDDQSLINYAGPGGYPYGPTLKPFGPYPSAKTGVIYLKAELVPPTIPRGVGNFYYIYPRFCFRVGNEIFISYTDSIETPATETELAKRWDWFKVFKFYLSDDMELLNDTMILDWELATYWDSSMATVTFWEHFKAQYGNIIPASGVNTQWPGWRDGEYYNQIKMVKESEKYNLVLSYNLPMLLDYDICSGSGGKMLKLGDLAKMAFCYEMWYVDVNNGGTLDGKAKQLLDWEDHDYLYDDKCLSIVSTRRLNLKRPDFSCFDILNLNDEACSLLKKTYTMLYNRRLYGIPCEEVEAISLFKHRAGEIVSFINSGKFVIVETQPVYSPDGFKFSRNKMWRLSYYV